VVWKPGVRKIAPGTISDLSSNEVPATLRLRRFGRRR
jgi:hypothetical protein